MWILFVYENKVSLVNTHFWLVTFSLSVVIIITRALPFLFAKIMTNRFNQLGKFLPAYIMMLLVIYEINLNKLSSPPYGLPAFCALSLLTLTHLLLRNTFVSLCVGTTSYLLSSTLISKLFS
jgi:branched chain amino acid efflux pump